MSEDDIDYGSQVVRALSVVGDSRAVRMLGRERGASYAQVIDAFIAWSDQHPDVETPAYRVKHFIADYCEQQAIPAAFYHAVASCIRGGVDPCVSRERRRQ